MGFREIVDSWRRIIMLARKPDREEYLLTLKMVLLGLVIVGGISFIIRVAFILFIFPYQGG
ncbi:MAG: protein translocase SEC61 complex subunit gamma [Thermoprotei archaeon]|nr:MAG: protein translocase SEC61 complex subunit gamma [Thermoprotei archaeon]